MGKAKQLGAFRWALVFGMALALTVLTTSTPVHANSAPDLDVGTLSVDDATPYTGESFTLSVTVTNTGDARSEATTLRYKQSDGTEVGTDAVGALEPGEESEQSITLIAPARRDDAGHGSYFTYKACVDTVTDESDTTDNCTDFVEEVLIQVSVRLPADLSMTSGGNRVSTVMPIPFGTGATFRLTSIVDNVGQTASVATTVRYYQSADTTITTSDTELGTSAIGAIAPASSSAQGINLTAPSTAGTYYYGVCVDTVTGESDTTNNCSSSVPVTVRDNSAATGAPTISGTAQVGQTLTASTSGISDSDGLTNVSYIYQWFADDTLIDGAISSTYTVQSSDNGKVIKVQVIFTDDGGSLEALTSEGTSAVVLGGL